MLAYLGVMWLVAWKSAAPIRVPLFFSPGQIGLPQESVEFVTEDGHRLSGWWMGRRDAKTIGIFIHGYMMNRSELASMAVMLWQRGAACLLFDTRAHGASGGRLTGFGYSERLDVRAAVDFARRQIPGARIVLFGSSMGGAAAAFAVAEDPALADALVLDSAYSRLDRAALGWWRFLGGRPLMVVMAPTLLFSRTFLPFRMRDADVAKALEEGDRPTLILHGREDRLAPAADAERNFAACNGRSRLVWFEGCNHSAGRFAQPEVYTDAVFGWLTELGLARESGAAPQGTAPREESPSAPIGSEGERPRRDFDRE